MPYRLLVDMEVVEILDALPKKLRSRLLDRFSRIKISPVDFSDYHEKDYSGRRVEICIFAGYAIHFWIDHADRHIKILALKLAD